MVNIRNSLRRWYRDRIAVDLRVDRRENESVQKRKICLMVGRLGRGGNLDDFG